MKQPKISILVPCCNVEKYVGQCLDSIVNQTLQDMEIIVINDGSTDGTLDIINEYAARDARIRVLDKPNEGYGKSMNRGLDMARGQYVGIVESDDWIDVGMFSELVKLADQYDADVVKSNFYEYTTNDGEKNIKKYICPTEYCGRVINPKIQNKIFLAMPSIWSAVYRREFLTENNIRFLESPGASYQDTGFFIKVMAMARRVYLTDAAYLHYRCDNANASMKSNGKIFCICDEWDEIKRYLDACAAVPDGVRRVLSYAKFGAYVWNYDRLTDDARNQFVARFRDEFSKPIAAGEIRRTNYADKEWCHAMRVIYPTSKWWRAQEKFWAAIRPIYKTRVRRGVKFYYLFGGITVRVKKLFS